MANSADYTVSTYTAQYDDAMRPRVEPEAGETYRIPEDPNGTGLTVDGREWDAFSRRCVEFGVRGEYSHTEDGWDHYTLVADPDSDNELNAISVTHSQTGEQRELFGDTLEELHKELADFDPDASTHRVLNEQGFTIGWVSPTDWRAQ